MTPLSPPIGGRTTFRTKVRLNIKTPSIKGEVKIRVIIINKIKKMAHKVFKPAVVFLDKHKESLA